MKYYVIEYENGASRYGEFYCYSDAIDYAESYSGGYDYIISEYASKRDYLINL